MQSPTAHAKSGNTTPHVRFSDVRKSYGSLTVIQGLNLDVEKGEFLTLLGPSGSGKTTTLMMLAGFETTSGGEILLENRPISQLPPHRRGIGMVFQSYALFPHMTIAENLAFPLEVRAVSKSDIATRVKAALDMVELPKLGDRRPAQLSGGQQQRIALARALIFEPPIVLMDEPLGALDKHLREQMQYEIKALHRRLGITMVYVTHDQSEALTMSDRIAVFDQGRIQQLSEPETLYNTPANAFVASFIGENNGMHGTLVERLDDGFCRVQLSGGQLIEGIRCEGVATGEPVAAYVRPERMRIAEGLAGISGTVIDRVFHGDHVRCLISAGGISDFVYKSGVSASGPDLSRGGSVTLSWSPADCRVFRRPSSTTPLDSRT